MDGPLVSTPSKKEAKGDSLGDPDPQPFISNPKESDHPRDNSNSTNFIRPTILNPQSPEEGEEDGEYLADDEDGPTNFPDSRRRLGTNNLPRHRDFTDRPLRFISPRAPRLYVDTSASPSPPTFPQIQTLAGRGSRERIESSGYAAFSEGGDEGDEGDGTPSEEARARSCRKVEEWLDGLGI